jgi:hypothetical protein
MTKRSSIGLMLAGVLAVAACGDDDAGSSISGVIPGDVFAGRSANVLISGDDTSWSEDAAVAFGDGITVDDVVVASPTALWVSITVDPDAEIGPRTVTVDSLDFADAFSVVSALQVASIAGPLAQGSIASVTVQSLDFTTPFDTTAGNLEIVLPDGSGVTATPGTAGAFTFSFTTLVDVDAAEGTLDLTINSGPAGGDTTSFFLPAGLTVEARDAEVVGLDEMEGEFGVGGDSKLFKIEPEELQVITAVGLFDDPNGAIQFVVLGESGHFDDIVALGAPGFFEAKPGGTFQANQPG